MRKLTPVQQEVIDLMKQGWELGSSLDASTRCWLQKGGLGKGGESKTVSSATVRTLEYLGYIERGERHFPTLHYRLKTETPVTKEVVVKSDPIHDEDFKHPSYGTISFTRAQGSDNVLFGSSIKHNNVIIVRISHAEKHLSNTQEYVFEGGVIVEAYMSPTQFADAITGFGQGSGTPITLQFTEKDGRIDKPAFINKRETFEAEFEKRATDIIKRLDDTINKAKDKNLTRWLVDDIETTKNWLQSNIPYLAEQFAEQMDKTVTEAKGEVEAYITGIIHQTGLEALADMKPELPSGNRTGQPDEVPLELPTSASQEDRNEIHDM